MAIQTPAADRLRPADFDQVAGQQHLVGESGILRRLSDSGHFGSMIFFGPPGTGKTTCATIIAQKSGMELRRLNATTASLSDVKAVAAETEGLLGQNGILLYLDEIQYFNKKQQQSLLEYIEDGRITLIASTTENPYYYIYDALLSRCSVFEFRPVSAQDVFTHLQRVADTICSNGADEKALQYVASVCGGDVRRALTMLECAGAAAGGTVTEDIVRALTPSVMAGSFDRDGDVHYDLLSALQKSIRGSDPNAAVFYLARLLEGGDLISPCRRLQVIASEDIGAAYPMAAVITRACVESARELGLPEAQIPLANAAVMLATAPKSNTTYAAVNAAFADVRAGKGREVPDHLRSPKFEGYIYPHDYPGRWVDQQYLPTDLKDQQYYQFGENKTEQAAAAYWDKVKKK